MKSRHLNERLKPSHILCLLICSVSTLSASEGAGIWATAGHSWTPRRTRGCIKTCPKTMFPLRCVWLHLSRLHSPELNDKNEHISEREREREKKAPQLQVKVTESVNTNLLLSGELGNLRQRRLSIPVDVSVFSLCHRNKHRADASVWTAGLLTSWQKKPRSGYFSVFADWAGQTSPSAARLLFFLLPLLLLVLTRRSSPQTHTQRCSGTPSLLATCCHSNPPGRLYIASGWGKGVALIWSLQITDVTHKKNTHLKRSN